MIFTINFKKTMMINANYFLNNNILTIFYDFISLTYSAIISGFYFSFSVWNFLINFLLVILYGSLFFLSLFVSIGLPIYSLIFVSDKFIDKFIKKNN